MPTWRVSLSKLITWHFFLLQLSLHIIIINTNFFSFKNLADRELENFLNSASKSPFSVPTITSSATLNPAPYTEIDFVKRLQPKLSEIRRVYLSPDFKFYRRPQIKIDLSAIKNAIASELGVEEDDGESFRRWRMRFKEKEREEGQFGFLKMSNVKLPESGVAFVDRRMGLDRCREMCRRNCSCRGYSDVDISGGGTVGAGFLVRDSCEPPAFDMEAVVHGGGQLGRKKIGVDDDDVEAELE
ncbi:Digalactosyldiacylglycerol synthase 1, chloroplastic [Castilleja foliolosa]|uniref:Digalactosyldiacylglycerol synthase 1, chloroplastic n=1 Tax=Castilleja foliolosa TaxID=1961234 RepID=A0ABD3BPM1_9LAMI